MRLRMPLGTVGNLEDVCVCVGGQAYDPAILLSCEMCSPHVVVFLSLCLLCWSLCCAVRFVVIVLVRRGADLFYFMCDIFFKAKQRNGECAQKNTHNRLYI